MSESFDLLIQSRCVDDFVRPLYKEIWASERVHRSITKCINTIASQWKKFFFFEHEANHVASMPDDLCIGGKFLLRREIIRWFSYVCICVYLYIRISGALYRQQPVVGFYVYVSYIVLYGMALYLYRMANETIHIWNAIGVSEMTVKRWRFDVKAMRMVCSVGIQPL